MLPSLLATVEKKKWICISRDRAASRCQILKKIFFQVERCQVYINYTQNSQVYLKFEFHLALVHKWHKSRESS